MSESEKDLIFRLADGHEACLPIIFTLYQFRRRWNVMMWLWKSRIVGQSLIDLYREFHSPIFFYNHCLKKAEGRNFNRITGADLV